MIFLADLIPPRPATPAFPEVVTQHPVAAVAVVVVVVGVGLRWWRGRSKR